MMKDLEDLGCANYWEEPPEVVHSCAMAGHVKESEAISDSRTRCWCEKCGYEFWFDSSD